MTSGPDEPPHDVPQVLARHEDDHGELVLRRRGDVIELVVDGVFAMDSAHTATEAALAELALHDLSARDTSVQDWDVVVGGLGLGFTTARLLDHPRVRTVRVVELHAALVGWVRDGVVPSFDRADGVLTDPRVRVQVGDVLDAVPALPPGSVDAILLDVDNGPGFLVHEANAAVYRPDFLAAAARALRPGGVLGIWSADPAPGLVTRLEQACGPCREVTMEVLRDGRRLEYAVYLSRHLPPTTPPTTPPAGPTLTSEQR